MGYGENQEKVAASDESRVSSVQVSPVEGVNAIRSSDRALILAA